ncbi:fructosamine kinase family protein [Halobacillus yeomjeoni]|uniref:fructosamine kinase family protein n=1 Tax=Halobacillus yeomjeoni TaxID=311194 RepID=UPI001CD6C407|nr:fructosamine kinase family protein [Halobacillus yeomjeoni]MCA0985409.1 fructosamine kinase family protein [Halobacillus yeomjeoni]
MDKSLQRVLLQVGDQSSLKHYRPVSGGDINESFYVETEERNYFIKKNKNVPSHFFQAEADGLAAIDRTNTVHVPQVLHYDQPEQGKEAYLVMDWVEPGFKDASIELGHKVALMHQHTSERYGLGFSTFVGSLDQPNDWTNTWMEYYREFRLKLQLNIGIENHRIKGERRKKLESLIERLGEWIPKYPSSSLLHGDLWSGNYMISQEGTPFLIDPSILYGDPAFELAFTELFGGFSPDFYDAYREVHSFGGQYEETKPLYQLFYLLVHLNLFGESYGSSVDRILNKYVGDTI